jgi:Icc-related predicted phosphoesterase
VQILAFSDLHRDMRQARRLTEQGADVDLVIGAGDFASVHRGLEKTIGGLSGIETPALLVPGNNETEEALRDAADAWPSAFVLHGESREVGGLAFFGLGGGIPVTPWDWSFDLTEEAAAGLLDQMPEDCVLVLHSPPHGHVDTSSRGDHLGSRAILEAIEERRPRVAVCGHIHESWGQESVIGDTAVYNLGPDGRLLQL